MPSVTKKKIVVRRSKKNVEQQEENYSEKLAEIPGVIADLDKKVFLALTRGDKIPLPRLPRGRPKKDSTRQTILAEQKKVIYALHVRGMTVRRIEECTGLPIATIHDRISSAIQEQIKPLASEVLQVRLSQLETLIQDLTPRAIAGDEKAIRAILAIHDREAKYLGLDSADKLDVNVTPQDEATRNLILAARQKNNAELKKIQDAASEGEESNDE